MLLVLPHVLRLLDLINLQNFRLNELVSLPKNISPEKRFLCICIFISYLVNESNLMFSGLPHALSFGCPAVVLSLIFTLLSLLLNRSTDIILVFCLGFGFRFLLNSSRSISLQVNFCSLIELSPYLR